MKSDSRFFSLPIVQKGFLPDCPKKPSPVARNSIFNQIRPMIDQTEPTNIDWPPPLYATFT